MFACVVIVRRAPLARVAKKAIPVTKTFLFDGVIDV